jgi:hypothetical protein
MLEIRPLNNLSVHLDRLIHGRLWLKVIIGLVLGAGLGLLINPSRHQFRVQVSTFKGELMMDEATFGDQVRIDVSNWRAGMYLVVLRDQDALVEEVLYSRFMVTNN